MIWIWLLACESTQKEQDCSALKNEKKRDECFHNELLTMSSVELPALIVQAKKITDPLIRGAAVSAWVRDHNTEVTQKQGMELCALLDGRDRFYCVRRLSSPHLKR
jgi:hypothetical protein